MKNNSNSHTNSDRAGKPGKARGPVQRDAKEVMAELVAGRVKNSNRDLQERGQEKGGSRIYLVPIEIG